jgi:L-aminopeptidase/D-esterase-like protein
MAADQTKRPPTGTLTDVPGLKVGHFTSDKRPTGCTVIVAEQGAVAGVDVRGGAPGTRETDLLRPEMSIQKAHAVALSGGSAYGLATADGVMRYLEERDIGFPTSAGVVPIVPAAIIYDLSLGNSTIRPDAQAGYNAAQRASGDPVRQGNIGAGAGATVGKLLGRSRAMKGGLGSASIILPNGLIIGALAAVNAIGDIVDPDTGVLLAGARTEDGHSLVDAMEQIRTGVLLPDASPTENTTIGVVAANVDWTQAQATKVAQMAHDGLARATRPAHLPFDGDTIFALGTGGPTVDNKLLGQLGALAADVMAQAIVSAILHAESIEGYPAHRDLK